MLIRYPKLVLCTILLAAIVPDSVAQQRSIEVNGRSLDARGMQALRRIEAQFGPVPDGRYWYDSISGGAGQLGGPASSYLGPGLPLGGPMPASASGGGNGRLTGVFINGRELHPLDVQGLSRYGQVLPGRYWWDGAGNVGYEGMPPMFNFYQVVAQQQQRTKRSSGGSYYRSDGPGENTFVGGGCVAVNLKSGASYYSGCD